MKKLGFLAAGLFSFSAYAAETTEPLFLPVLTIDFPDPFILQHGNQFLAYATNATGDRANVQMARSTNLVDWVQISDGAKLHDAMPTMPDWARSGFTWAPEVLKIEDGFVLHFTARDKKSDLQCLGAAFSTDPLGPFVSTAKEPLLCQTDLGGTIDSHAFRDSDGQLYLYYKNDGNNPKFGKPTDIYVQRLAADGLGVTGEAVMLLRNDRPWEAHVIEAPTMVPQDGRYTLFFSANHFGWEPHQRLSPYAVGYATCEGPMGPCTDAPTNPILNSFHDKRAGCLSGPGHQSVFDVGGRSFMSFHAWATTSGCRKFDNKRHMFIAPLIWKDGKPQLGVSLKSPAQGKRAQ